MKGRKLKPASLKLLSGNPGKRPVTPEMSCPVEIPDCPAELDADGQREWARITPLLAEAGLISKLDLAVLFTYCSSFALALQCEREIRETGVLVRLKNGYDIANPRLAIQNQALQRIKAFATELGLSPAARVRLPAKPKSPESNRFKLIAKSNSKEKN